VSNENDNPEYVPTTQFSNVNTLYGNHFRFVLDGLPDLTFFAQSFTLPSLMIGTADRGTPFVKIPEVGDHIQFSPFQVGYLIDNSFKTYFSLFYWLKGYGFPTSYQEILDFNASRSKRLGNIRPIPREIQKTLGTLTILQPDNDTAIAEVLFEDCFPTGLGEVPFATTDSEPPLLHTQVTFTYTDFNVRPLTNP
jgi:hypothetical protein